MIYVSVFFFPLNAAWSKDQQYPAVCKPENTLTPPTMKALFFRIKCVMKLIKEIRLFFSYIFESPCYLQSEVEIFNYMMWKGSLIFICKRAFH